MKIEDAEKHVKGLKELGHNEEEMTFNQSMPDEHLLLQGEAMNHNKSVYLYYTAVKKPMNLRLAEESHTVEEKDAVKILIENMQFLWEISRTLEETLCSGK